MEPSYDVLVVGAGCAGMRAAIEAHDRGARVAVISKLHPTRSHSGAAEGGIAATGAAISNAVAHALRPLGVTPLELPLSPNNLARWMREARSVK